jgi:hypothetical protein
VARHPILNWMAASNVNLGATIQASIAAPWEIWAHWLTSDSKSLVLHIKWFCNYSARVNEIPIHFTKEETKFILSFTQMENWFTQKVL